MFLSVHIRARKISWTVIVADTAWLGGTTETHYALLFRLSLYFKREKKMAVADEQIVYVWRTVELRLYSQRP